jgi:glycosyltransferase involved in cell wall biosynthesis
MPDLFPGRLGLIQRVVPAYRAPFFDHLAAASAGGLSVFAGQPLTVESIATASRLQTAQLVPARNLHIFNPQHPLYFCYQRGLTGWLDAWDPDALIIEANFRYLSSSAAIRWMKKRARPVIGWGLGVPLSRGVLSRLRTNFLKQFDALVAYSERGAEQYAGVGFPSNRIFVAPNAVAAKPVHPMPAHAERFDPQPVVLFVGRLQTRKRIPALLHACAGLPEQLKPRMVIVGDGPERKNLESLAAQTYPAAEFPGALHGPNLRPYFEVADLFILPGTGGLAVQEAMTYGLPVIVAQGDGTQDDLVHPGANGWLIPPDDDPALAAALREALTDIRRLRRMGYESYRIVSEEINLERMTAVFLRALHECVKLQNYSR